MTLNSLVKDQVAAILTGDRRALARAITLVESTRPDHRATAELLLAELLPYSGKSIRIGITGVPGAGKSTFIEAFGLGIINENHKVAVLAVDPSSPKTGGSILGDKTRMEELSRNASAFVRPSPSGGSLGGVARRTRDAMLIAEAAGFDVVIVETVGVGQSEIAVAALVDIFILLIVPGGGDDLQGIKKGIVELADLILVNKADGDLLSAAERAKRDYGAALHLLRAQNEGWKTKIMTCSSILKSGVDDVWKMVQRFKDETETDGNFLQRRKVQAVTWMWDEVNEVIKETLLSNKDISAILPELESQVKNDNLSPTHAAKKILQTIGILKDIET